MSKILRKESIKEMVHADKFVDRILFFKGLRNMQALEALGIGEDVKEIIA